MRRHGRLRRLRGHDDELRVLQGDYGVADGEGDAVAHAKAVVIALPRAGVGHDELDELDVGGGGC